MRNSMFQIEECLQNEDKALTKTKNTTINFGKMEITYLKIFFSAHKEDRERF